MSRPILVIKVPNYINNDDISLSNFRDRISNTTTLIQDYFTFIIPNYTNDWDFKVFNGEYTESEFTTLTKLIEELKK
jgi:hypothetical protein